MHTNPPPWPICFGLETELGITVMEDPEGHVFCVAAKVYGG